MVNFTVKTDVSEKWISKEEVEKLVAAVVAKCADVAAKNPTNAKDAVEVIKVKLELNNGFFKPNK